MQCGPVLRKYGEPRTQHNVRGEHALLYQVDSTMQVFRLRLCYAVNRSILDEVNTRSRSSSLLRTFSSHVLATSTGETRRAKRDGRGLAGAKGARKDSAGREPELISCRDIGALNRSLPDPARAGAQRGRSAAASPVPVRRRRRCRGPARRHQPAATNEQH